MWNWYRKDVKSKGNLRKGELAPLIPTSWKQLVMLPCNPNKCISKRKAYPFALSHIHVAPLQKDCL